MSDLEESPRSKGTMLDLKSRVAARVNPKASSSMMVNKGNLE